MAESVRAMARRVPLRVAIIVNEAARHASFAERIAEAGHVPSDVNSAEVALADADVTLPNVPAVVLTDNDSDAAGVIPADANAEQIDAALRAVAAGLSVRHRPKEQVAFAALEEADSRSLLTPRELEILVALSEGLSNKAVARKLDISQHTVKFHVESIFRKLGVGTRAEAVARGLRRGLVHL